MSPFLLVLALTQATFTPPAGEAAQPAPACTAMDQNLMLGLDLWPRTVRRLVYGGSAVILRGAPAPTRPGGHPGLGVSTAFSVPMNGFYGIALDQDGWIDVLPVMGEGSPSPLRTVGEEAGPACSTIRKIVYFNLHAGTRYSLALSGLPNATARVMLIGPVEAPPPPAGAN